MSSLETGDVSDPAAIDEPDYTLIARVRSLLGARLTAYIGGAASTATVADWATEGRGPNPEIVARLRVADAAARLLLDRDEPAVVQAWFNGMNPGLNDTAPARLLRDGDLATAGPEVLTAARAARSA